MEKVVIKIISGQPHCHQVMTGFHFLSLNNQIDLKVEDHRGDDSLKYREMALVEVLYEGKTLIYDLQDGYTCLQGMEYYLDKCDYYFKRSFSSKKNEMLFNSSQREKLYPLGLNYFVTYKGNPLNQDNRSVLERYALRIKPADYYTQEIFRSVPQYVEAKDLRILFFVRLWDQDKSISKESNIERLEINKMRIDIIRSLKKKYNGSCFIGGVTNSALARRICPDIIVSRFLTKQSNYLKTMLKSDICIGSMGLHESIGWKTAEYVAGAKAIVNEKLHYEVPGFAEGEHYIGFSTVGECLSAVEHLLKNPEYVYKMKKNNLLYYEKYLRPDMLVRNSLAVVSAHAF